MDRTPENDLNDRLREEQLREQRLHEGGLDRTGAPDSNASSESLVSDSMRAGAPIDREREALRRDTADMRADDVNPGDEIGEAVGGISGVLTGAALGSLGGPIGTIIGGVAGAVSGWWAGRAISEAASHATHDDDEYYKTHYETSSVSDRTRSFDQVRPAYQLGHIAGRNPDYKARSFDEVEGDLQHGWTSDVSQHHGEWGHVRDYARHAYDRGRTDSGMGTGGTHASTNLGSASMGGTSGMTGAGDVGDRLVDRSERAADHTGDALGHAWDKTKDAARHAGDKIGDALDDTKDRVDGNPASRPGPDRTDERDRLF